MLVNAVAHSLCFVASPRQCIDLFFDEKYALEPSWDCKFDHIEVRDGPFSSSPIMGRFCGQQSPTYVRSSGRYLWIKFVADSELEAIGFSARYNFTQGKRRVLRYYNTEAYKRTLYCTHSPNKGPDSSNAAQSTAACVLIGQH